ncbi:MAG: hypothetical protein V4501_12290 [Pseudomonadota bacterium]
MIIETHLQVRTNCLYLYNVYPKKFPASLDMQAKLLSINEKKRETLAKQETYSGVLCPGAKKRITKAVDILLQLSPKQIIFNPVTRENQPFQINFITLTVHSLNNELTGKETHKMLLEPFLQWLRRSKGVNSYVWKCERQGERLDAKQIHYHITTNVFIHYAELRAKWNELQRNAGYLDHYYNDEGINDGNPNSTDVHAIKKIKNLTGYILKYMAKNDLNTSLPTNHRDYVAPIGGKVWDCSKNIKSVDYYTTDAGPYSSAICALIEKKVMQAKHAEHCSMYKMLNAPAHSILSGTDKLDYKNFINNLASGKESTKNKDVVLLPDGSVNSRRMINEDLQEKTKRALQVKFKMLKDDLLNNGFYYSVEKMSSTKQLLSRIKRELSELTELEATKRVHLRPDLPLP